MLLFQYFRNNGYPLVNSGSRQNSIVNSIAPQPRAAVVASNVYLDTVSSLDDFATGNNSRRLKVRNSSEFTGSMAGSRRIAPKPSKGPVTYKHDPRDGAARRVKDPRKPNEPWKPVGRYRSIESKRFNLFTCSAKQNEKISSKDRRLLLGMDLLPSNITRRNFRLFFFVLPFFHSDIIFIHSRKI